MQCPDDNSQGCVWARNVDSPEDIFTYCASLKLGCARNWRVPTISELFSLVIIGPPPMIDSAAFPDAETFLYEWSSTPGLPDPAVEGVFVTFEDGIVGGGEPVGIPVRCVHN